MEKVVFEALTEDNEKLRLVYPVETESVATILETIAGTLRDFGQDNVIKLEIKSY